MDVFLGEWVNLLLRWFHMIVGIGWIGTSFYFMALDYGLDTKERKSAGFSRLDPTLPPRGPLLRRWNLRLNAHIVDSV